MRWLVGVGWVFFALILILMGQQFLFACGFHLASFTWNACPADVNTSPLIEEAERGETLQRQVHAAEMTLAQKPACDTTPERKPESDKTKKTAYDRGAAPGRLEVLLAWHTLDDVDLEIVCPGGQIGGQSGRPGPGVCGDGKLDLDANRNLTENIQTEPVEHVVWRDNIPDGEYRFMALIFKVKDPTHEQTIPFEMTVSLDGEQKKCSSSLNWFPRWQNINSAGGGTLATKVAILTWRAGAPLPECNWTWQDAIYCNGGCEKN